MKDVIPEHHIQKSIFNRLVSADSLRYSELKPKELEANLFMYHLKELIKMGLVEKQDVKYQLTKKGRSTATRFSIREKSIRVMPSTVSILLLISADQELLIYERHRQPYINFYSLPSGKIHLGDSLESAAYRELSEKCGYIAEEVNLRHAGQLNLVEYDEANELQNHILGQIWTGNVREKRIYENHAGITRWSTAQELSSYELIPGTKEIIDHIKSPDFFVLDLKF